MLKTTISLLQIAALTGSSALLMLFPGTSFSSCPPIGGPTELEEVDSESVIHFVREDGTAADVPEDYLFIEAPNQDNDEYSGTLIDLADIDTFIFVSSWVPGACDFSIELSAIEVYVDTDTVRLDVIPYHKSPTQWAAAIREIEDRLPVYEQGIPVSIETASSPTLTDESDIYTYYKGSKYGDQFTSERRSLVIVTLDGKTYTAMLSLPSKRIAKTLALAIDKEGDMFYLRIPYKDIYMDMHRFEAIAPSPLPMRPDVLPHVPEWIGTFIDHSGVDQQSEAQGSDDEDAPETKKDDKGPVHALLDSIIQYIRSLLF